MASIKLCNLTKEFKGHSVLQGIDLQVRDKEFLVLVGPSGCGKSTCLRMIAGLEEPTSGEIYIGDRRVNDISPKDRDIAMVFQSYALYPHMSVYDNMAFGLRMRNRLGTVAKLTRNAAYKQREAEIHQLVTKAAGMLDLGELLQRKPKQLSGGQRQRVALGRAIVREPQVFLMDEPLSNLDAKLRVQTRAELIKLHRRLGVTTIYVTHDQVEAMTMGDRIAVMKDGVLQQCDTPLNLYHHPENVFVAGFIGSPGMNFLKMKVAVEGEAVFLGAEGVRVRAPQRAAANLKAYAGQEVLFGIRPSDIACSTYLPAGLKAEECNTIRARCEVTETMGDRTYLFLAGPQGPLVADVAAEAEAREEQDIDLVLNMERSHAFDVQSEQAIY
jgi:multiple sugar transport system ATP-binding protein